MTEDSRVIKSLSDKITEILSNFEYETHLRVKTDGTCQIVSKCDNMTFSSIEEMIEKYEEEEKSFFYDVGSVFMVDKERYILAKVTKDEFSLISLSNGNRFRDPVTTSLRGLKCDIRYLVDFSEYDVKYLGYFDKGSTKIRCS